MPGSTTQQRRDTEKEDAQRCDLVFGNILWVQGCKTDKLFTLIKGKKRKKSTSDEITGNEFLD